MVLVCTHAICQTLSLNQGALPNIDEEFEDITEGEEESKKQQLKSKWAALEALVGDPKSIALMLSQFWLCRRKNERERFQCCLPAGSNSLW